MLKSADALHKFAIAALLLLLAQPVQAQIQSSGGYGAPGVQTPSIGTQSQPASLGTSAAPAVNIPAQAAKAYESNPILSLPDMFARQWTVGGEFTDHELYLLRQENTARPRMTLKETIYLALRNNPGLQSVALDPIAATESVKAANAQFDPNLSSQLDVEKEVSPVSSPFQNPGNVANEAKFYDWNFGVSKVLSTTNATVALTFENDREETNSAFNPVNPMYTPLLQLSLSQPLLQNFGWQFATINVRMAESAQRASQWSYGSNLNDFVQRIGNDYWGVVGAQENLRVAQAALKFNRELARVNGENVRVGMMAAVNLFEARSAEETAKANVVAAQAALITAQDTLAQDVALNSARTLVGENIEPAQQPDVESERLTREASISSEEALHQMLEYSPALGGLRESIQTALLQVKYSENQTLPQLNLGAGVGLTSEAGHAYCTASFSVPSYANCIDPEGPTTKPPGLPNAAILPFGGQYSDALNRLFDFRFYDYAAVLSFSMPLDNAAAKAALAQARVSYDQARLQYRQALLQNVLQVKTALSNLRAYTEQVKATKEAVDYAAKALNDTESQFRVGMATTNTLLQYQSNLVTSQGNDVQADVGLENARLALWHAEGTLLRHFNIEFKLQKQASTPWYARF
jgi:outer membrane protein TolC